MNIAHCQQCGGCTPEGFSLCPACMSRAGAGKSEVTAAVELLEIASIVNMGDTDASRRDAIRSILSIKNRLEESDRAEKEKAKAQPKKESHFPACTKGKSAYAADGRNKPHEADLGGGTSSCRAKAGAGSRKIQGKDGRKP